MTALPLQDYISQAAQAETEYKILEVKYGNGYSQRAGDGYNKQTESWNLTWDNITLAQLSTLRSAFDAAGGVANFTWMALGDSVDKKWIVKKHSRSVKSGSVYTLSATLERVFDL
ncbi:phage tail protein [Aquabacterium sp.]|uniref:phage tail protein n=1 Tax=Aquabacterium sp. TaxID=1872578 RepID=UPI003D6C848F